MELHAAAEARGPARFFGQDHEAEAAYEAKELGEAINRFAMGLPERERSLFVRRYFFAEDIAVIAKKYRMTENNVTVSLSRIRKKLRKNLTEGGFIV